MNSTFARYVTNTAFSISLSQDMIRVLDLAVRGVAVLDWGIRNHISPWRSLERRGLVEFRGELQGNVFKNGEWRDPAWIVTSAGYAMHNLLAEAEMVKRFEPKKETA